MTYIIYQMLYSENAGHKYGRPYVWEPVEKTRLKPPRDEMGFHNWLWGIISKHGPGYYRIVRNQAKGERAGFHGVVLCYIDQEYIRVERTYPDVKAVPGLPQSRQPWYQKPKQPTKFRKRGNRF